MVGALEDLHQGLDRFWEGAASHVDAPVGSEFRLLFELAVVEIVTNILQHSVSDLGLSEVRVDLLAFGDRVEARFCDRGRPFTLPLPGAASSLEGRDEIPEHGYGLGIARAALDQLMYERTSGGINCWHLVKRLHSD